GTGAHPLTHALIPESGDIDFITTNNELEAILLENHLIKTPQPCFTALLREDKTYPYSKVTMSEDYPRVVVTRRVDRKKGDLFFGPFFAGTARRILKLVADQFKLRSCDLDIAEGKSALTRPCLYYDMHQCLGPCIVGLTTSEEYHEMVDDVVLFLSGKSKELQDRLSARMYRAAEEDRVELANRNARLSHESRFRKSQQDRLQIAASRLAQILGYQDRDIQKIESFDISNIQGSDSVAGMVVLDRGKFDKNQYRVFNIRSVVGADDFRSMAEAVDRRYRRLLDEERPLPDMILIDGGRGQLNAALTALNRLGVEGITIAGLAKREEEIYVPDREEPSRLD